jgi:ribosomal protein L22
MHQANDRRSEASSNRIFASNDSTTRTRFSNGIRETPVTSTDNDNQNTNVSSLEFKHDDAYDAWASHNARKTALDIPEQRRELCEAVASKWRKDVNKDWLPVDTSRHHCSVTIIKDEDTTTSSSDSVSHMFTKSKKTPRTQVVGCRMIQVVADVYRTAFSESLHLCIRGYCSKLKGDPHYHREHLGAIDEVYMCGYSGKEHICGEYCQEMTMKNKDSIMVCTLTGRSRTEVYVFNKHWSSEAKRVNAEQVSSGNPSASSYYTTSNNGENIMGSTSGKRSNDDDGIDLQDIESLTENCAHLGDGPIKIKKMKYGPSGRTSLRRNNNNNNNNNRNTETTSPDAPSLDTVQVNTTESLASPTFKKTSARKNSAKSVRFDLNNNNNNNNNNSISSQNKALSPQPNLALIKKEERPTESPELPKTSGEEDADAIKNQYLGFAILKLSKIFSQSRFEQDMKKEDVRKEEIMKHFHQYVSKSIQKNLPLNTMDLYAIAATIRNKTFNSVDMRTLTDQQRTYIIVHYAKQCLALWYVIRTRTKIGQSDPKQFPWPEFVDSAMLVFEAGFEISPRDYPYKVVLIPKDPLLSLLPDDNNVSSYYISEQKQQQQNNKKGQNKRKSKKTNQTKIKNNITNALISAVVNENVNPELLKIDTMDLKQMLDTSVFVRLRGKH